MNTFKLEIVTPDGIIFEDEVDEVRLPTLDGQIAILPHHVPLYTRLGDGEAIIIKSNKEIIMAILGGVVEVGKDRVSIVSDYAVHADNINIARAEEAKKRAEEAKKNKEATQGFILEDKEIRKSIMELKVAHKVKHANRM